MRSAHRYQTWPKRSNHLSDECGSGCRVVLEGRRDLLLRFVVTCEAVNAGIDENEAELRILVLAVNLEVLADGDRLFDEVPKVLWDGWCQAYPQTKSMTVHIRQRPNGSEER